MMIQLNLLPDIKLKYIKAKNSKRRVMIFSILAVGVSLGLMLLMLSLSSLQKKHINDLNKDIDSAQKQLESVPDLEKILTIQNQLNTLPGLYAQRPVSSRLFSYMEQTTPADISGISSLLLDFSAGTLTIEGKSTTLESVNRFIDSLKFTTYKAVAVDSESSTESDTSAATKAFSEVVLSDFERKDAEATFTITLKFDPVIFDAAYNVTLSVPQTVSTRSETELPGSGIFNTTPAETE